MKNQRRDFLREVAIATTLPTLTQILRIDREKEATKARNSRPRAMVQDFRAHFPLLKESVDGRPLVYLDSAATTQRPRAVLDSVANFYLHDNANPAKALHGLARRSAGLYEEARASVARFLHARGAEEIVFTRGTTEAINIVASSWGSANLRSGH